MNWIETLGPSRPPLIASRRLPTSITAPELGAIFENLQADELSTGYKTNIDLQTLCKCLYAAAKMEADEMAECEESEEFHELYRELFSFIDVYLTEFPCLKRSPGDTEVILYCLGTLVDLSKFLLRSISESSPPKRVRDAVFIVRALCRALDRDTPFHQQHEHMALPTGLLEGPRRYASYRCIDIATEGCGSNPMKRRRSMNTGPAIDRSSCRCSECGTSEPHLWLKCLVEHFGRACPGYHEDTRGFDILRRLFPRLHQLPLELTEVVLHLFSRTTDTLRDDLRSNLAIPFMELLKGLVERCGRDLDRSSIEVFITILKHLRVLLKFLFSPEIAENLVAGLQQQIQETLTEVMAVDSQSGITPGLEHSMSEESNGIQNHAPIVSSLDAIISHCLAWIRSTLYTSSDVDEDCTKEKRHDAIAAEPPVQRYATRAGNWVRRPF